MKTVNNNSIWLPAIFEDFFVENNLNKRNNFSTIKSPALNVIENFTMFVIELAAPGFQKNSFTIEVEEDTLKIKASVQKEANESSDKTEETRYLRREFSINDFERSFKLPEDIQVDDIQANYENGVLSITLPKMEKKKAEKRMVEIS